MGTTERSNFYYRNEPGEFYYDDDISDTDNEENDWFSYSKKWSSSQEPMDMSFMQTKLGAYIDFNCINSPLMQKVSFFYACARTRTRTHA